MRQTYCCFTGHRALPAGGAQLNERLNVAIERLAGAGIVCFAAGGALGFDTLAAQAVLAARRRLPAIRLHLVLPCTDQAARWPVADQQRYEAIREQADEVEYITGHYFNGCMQMRNRRLVALSSVCVCYLTRRSGGTWQTVNLCRRQGLRVINLAEAAGPQFPIAIEGSESHV